MRPSSLAMLKALIGHGATPPKVKLPQPMAIPTPLVAVHIHPPGGANEDKPANDPTDPNQLLESERTPLGPKPSMRIPVKLALPRNPIKG